MASYPASHRVRGYATMPASGLISQRALSPVPRNFLPPPETDDEDHMYPRARPTRTVSLKAVDVVRTAGDMDVHNESAVPSAIGGAAPKEQDTRQPIIKFATMPVRPTKWNNQVDEIRQMMNQFDVSSAGAQRQARRPPSPSVRSIYWAEHEQQRQEALRRAAAAAQSRAVRPRTPTPEPEPAPQVDTTPRNPTDESCAPPPPPAPPKEKPFFKKFISRSLGRQSMLGRIFLSSKKEHIVQPSMIPPAGYFKVGEGLSQRSAFQNVGWAEEQRQYLRVLEESRGSARG